MSAKTPIDGVSRPRADKKEKKELKSRKKSYTPSEAAEVISRLYEGPTVWKLYFVGVLLGGFRRWTAVDFEHGVPYSSSNIWNRFSFYNSQAAPGL
jgi:integrase